MFSSRCDRRISRQATTGHASPSVRLAGVIAAMLLLLTPGQLTGAASSSAVITVGGYAFQDANRSGGRDPGEPGWAGVVVFIDRNGDGELSEREVRARTDASGAFQLQTLESGRLTVCMAPPAGLLRTTERCGPALANVGVDNVPVAFGLDRPGERCPGGAIVDTIVGIRQAGGGPFLPPAMLSGPARGPWAGTRMGVDPRSGSLTVYARRGERLRHLVVIAPHDGMARPVVRLALSRGLERIARITTEGGAPAVNLGRGRRLPSPAPTAFSYFEQGDDLVVFGLPKASDNATVVGLIVETEVTTGSKAFRVASRLEGTIRIDGRVRALPTCRDTTFGKGF